MDVRMELDSISAINLSLITPRISMNYLLPVYILIIVIICIES